jgi:hypothetical protein
MVRIFTAVIYLLHVPRVKIFDKQCFDKWNRLLENITLLSIPVINRFRLISAYCGYTFKETLERGDKSAC